MRRRGPYRNEVAIADQLVDHRADLPHTHDWLGWWEPVTYLDPHTGESWEDDHFCWQPDTTHCAQCGVSWREWWDAVVARARDRRQMV
jgi:hypothetical protein